jgi:hypothetical protein
MSNVISTTVEIMLEEVKTRYQKPVAAALENQFLSDDPQQRVRQLDQQAIHDRDRIAGN